MRTQVKCEKCGSGAFCCSQCKWWVLLDMETANPEVEKLNGQRIDDLEELQRELSEWLDGVQDELDEKEIVNRRNSRAQFIMSAAALIIGVGAIIYSTLSIGSVETRIAALESAPIDSSQASNALVSAAAYLYAEQQMQKACQRQHDGDDSAVVTVDNQAWLLKEAEEAFRKARR